MHLTYGDYVIALTFAGLLLYVAMTRGKKP